MKDLTFYLVFVVYTGIIYYIVYRSSKKIKTIKDYIIGGRNMSGFVTAMSVGASDMSSWLLMALPGAIFTQGLSVVWVPISLTLGSFFNWILVSKKLRIQSEKYGDSITISEYLSNRYNDSKKSIRLSSSIFMLIFFILYIVAGFISAAKLAELAFGISYIKGLTISIIFISLYTMIGGYIAVSWVDVLQGLMMFIGLLIVPSVFYKSKYHSIQSLILDLKELKPNYFHLFKNTSPAQFISLFAWGLGYMGQPHIIGRFMSIKSPKQLPFAKNICTIWMILVMIFACLVGISGALMYLQNGLKDAETVFLELSKDLFSPFVNAILLCAVISSIMSTSSALILMSANTFAEDILLLNVKSKYMKNNKVFINRVVLVLISMLSFKMASNPKSSIMSSVALPWCGLGATFGPIILFSLYSKRINSKGAFWGIISGGVTVLLFEFLVRYSNIDIIKNTLPGISILPSFMISSIFILFFSRNNKKTKENNQI